VETGMVEEVEMEGMGMEEMVTVEEEEIRFKAEIHRIANKMNEALHSRGADAVPPIFTVVLLTIPG
jgi:ribosomal protein L31E